MGSWGTIQSLLIFFGPLLIPKALSYYRSLRSRPASQLRPLQPKTTYALAILFASGLVAFLSTLPLFHPPNIFQQTQSRLQTPAGVLLTRLAALRSRTSEDERLRAILDSGGLEARLLYVRFGPHVLLDCPFATPGTLGAAQDYFFYATPAILAPHLLHLLALGVATSSMLSGSEGARWRVPATVAGIVLAVAELAFIASYDDQKNIRSTRLSEVDFIYWKLLVYRGLAISTLDGVLGWVVWLQATGRAFLAPPTTGEKLDGVGKGMEMALGRVRGLGLLRNGVVRDAGLRRRYDGYWVREGEVMKDVMETAEVMDAQRKALGRLDMARVGREADGVVEGILGGMEVRGEAPG